MSEEFEHLAPECRATAKLSAEERVRLALTERWISYPRASLALSRLGHLMAYLPRDRMPCLLLYGATGMGKTKILKKFIRSLPRRSPLRRGLRPFTNGPLNSPWGLARVPQEFGKFGHDVLLVGNFGDGMINAFNIHTGGFIAALLHRPGQPLDFNGLWSLFFLDDKLYFTAGIVDEAHGLFGVIKAAQEEEDFHD